MDILVLVPALGLTGIPALIGAVVEAAVSGAAGLALVHTILTPMSAYRVKPNKEA